MSLDIRSLRNVPFRRWMVIATGLSLVLNIVVLLTSKGLNLWGDAYFYHHAANLVADGKGWINPMAYKELGIVRQAADHPPIHWGWLALFSYAGFDSIGAHQFATILMGVAAVPLFGYVGRRIGGHTVGILAAFLACVHAGLWGWNKMIMAEPSAILGIMLLFAAACRVIDQENPRTIDWKNLALLGAGAGFATLARAELALTSALVFAIVIVSRAYMHSVKRLLIAGAVFLLVLAPWVTFNMSRFNSTVILSNGAEITFAASNCPETYSGTFAAYWFINCALTYENNAKEKFPGADQSIIMKEIGRQGVQFAKDRPKEFVKMMVLRVARVTGLYRPIQQMKLDHNPEGRDKYVVYLAWGTYAFLLPFSIAGAYMLRNRKRYLFALLASIAVALFSCAITFGNTRYRTSAEPALILMASLSLVAAARGIQRLWNSPDAR